MEIKELDYTGKKIGDKVKIMHISDLHFNNVNQEKLTAFHSDMAKYKPTIIVISGDLIENPWIKRNIDKAREFISDIRQHTETVIIAPGNHEKLFKFGKKKVEDRLHIIPDCCYYIRFGNNRHMPFFVFDSTHPFFSFKQRGIIDKSQIQGFHSCLRELRSRYVQDYDRSVKIVVLHHHILPTKRNQYEQLLYLKNAGEFIESLTQENINLVLHGHQHDPVDYSFQWNLRPISPQPHMVIISAGTLLRNEVNEKKTDLCEKTNYCQIEIKRDRIVGRQLYYNYILKEFMVVKPFKEKMYFPKYYKYDLELIWEILHPNYDAKITRIMTFRSWADNTVNNIKEAIGSTINANIDDIKLKINRKGYGEIKPNIRKMN